MCVCVCLSASRMVPCRCLSSACSWVHIYMYDVYMNLVMSCVSHDVSCSSDWVLYSPLQFPFSFCLCIALLCFSLPSCRHNVCLCCAGKCGGQFVAAVPYLGEIAVFCPNRRHTAVQLQPSRETPSTPPPTPPFTQWLKRECLFWCIVGLIVTNEGLVKPILISWQTQVHPSDLSQR